MGTKSDFIRKVEKSDGKFSWEKRHTVFFTQAKDRKRATLPYIYIFSGDYPYIIMQKSEPISPLPGGGFLVVVERLCLSLARAWPRSSGLSPRAFLLSIRCQFSTFSVVLCEIISFHQ